MYDVRWVHVFEDDTTSGEVYRAATDEIPLSRRPRDAFELHRDGTAQVLSGGPDDRAVARDARWTDTPNGIVVETSSGTRFRIVKHTAVQLIVSRH
ncbi:MAG: hypothetical protein ABIP90_12490 [Vicinamibacterales bacterium]